MSTAEGESCQAATWESFTPEQKRRYSRAVRVVMEYALDKAPLNRENEKQETGECQKATPPETVQLWLEI